MARKKLSLNQVNRIKHSLLPIAKHHKYVIELEKKCELAYDLVTDKIINEVIKLLKEEKLVKAEDPPEDPTDTGPDMPIGWKNNVPTINVNIADTISEEVEKHLKALKYILLGKAAGTDAEKAVEDLQIKTKVPSGSVVQSFLGSVDAQLDQNLMAGVQKSISNSYIENSLDFISQNTGDYIDASLKDLKNQVMSRMQDFVDVHNIEMYAAVRDNYEHFKELNPTAGKRAVVKLAIDAIAKREMSITQAKQALKDTFKDYGGANWNRIIRTELGMATNVGITRTIQETVGADGTDPVVVILNVDDQRVSKFCKGHSRNPDGSLKYFHMSTLKPAGYNLGRKAKEWMNCIPLRHINCFDDQTEVLTRRGWHLFKDCVPTDEYLSVDLATGQGEWTKAVGYVWGESKEMIHYKNHRVDMMITPQHNQIVRQLKEKPGKIKYYSEWVIKPENELIGNNYQFLSTIPNWKGEEVTSDFTLPGFSCDFKLWAQFMGYWLSEGSIATPSNPNKKYHELKVTQQKIISKGTMFDCIEKVFENTDCKVWRGENACYVKLTNIEIVNYFKKFGHSHQKFVPDDIKNSSKEILKIFLDAYLLGDGSKCKGVYWKGQFKDQRNVSTNSPQMGADLGEIMLKLGKRPSYNYKKPKPVKHRNGTYTAKYTQICITECTQVYFKKCNMTRTVVPYSGIVYDVELEKNHTLFVKRNGKVVLSGNCRCQLILVPHGFRVDNFGSLVKLTGDETLKISG